MIMHATEGITQSYVFFLICYDLAEKGMGLNTKKEDNIIVKVLRLSMIVCSIIFLGVLVYQIVIFNSIDVNHLCHSPVFVIPNTVNLFIGICFIWVVT
jgi:hypothetical protein